MSLNSKPGVPDSQSLETPGWHPAGQHPKIVYPKDKAAFRDEPTDRVPSYDSFESQAVTLYGSKTHYWVFHEDKPQTIVMVHGFRGTHHGLQEIINKLPDFRVIIPDMPGFGASTPMTQQRHDIAGYSAFVAQFIQVLGLHQPVLLGHSFGSIIAADVAAHRPDLINKLILINPIASPALKGPRKIFTQLARVYYWLGKSLPEKPGRALLANPAITLSTSAILSKTKDKTLRQQTHRKHLQHFSTFQTRDALGEAFIASVSATAADHAEYITTPTLLIAGSLDDIAPLSAQHELERRIPKAHLEVLAGTGHLIHHEKPQQAAKAITHFLQT